VLRFSPFLTSLLLLISVASIGFSAESDPVRGFVNVEPFELRVEALIHVEAFRERWRIEGETIEPAQKSVILDNLLTLLASGVTVKGDGRSIAFPDQSIQFVVRDEVKGYLPDERDTIPLSEALVGVTLSAAESGVRSLDIEWFWFGPAQDKVVVEIASRGKPSARIVTPDATTFSWAQSEEVLPPSLMPVPNVQLKEDAPFRYLLFVGIALFLFALITVIKKKILSPSWVWWLFLGSLLLAFISLKVRINTVQMPESEMKEEIVYALLRNTYHAFDFRDESAIYDTLEKSVAGSLLEKIYLEIYASLKLENAGGPRVRVYEIALRDVAEMSSDDVDSFVSKAEWVTIGQITHWGHTHERTNKYEAQITATLYEGEWKISELDLLNEERVQKVSRQSVTPEA
jgi:hypothetical protein